MHICYYCSYQCEPGKLEPKSEADQSLMQYQTLLMVLDNYILRALLSIKQSHVSKVHLNSSYILSQRQGRPYEFSLVV